MAEIRNIGTLKYKSLLHFIIYFAFFFQILIDVFSAPTIFRYLIDLIIIFLTFFTEKYEFGIQDKNFYIYRKWIILYVAYLTIVYMFNFQSIAYMIYGLKNNIRYPLFFFLCIKYFDKEDVEKIVNFINKLFYINFFAIVLEYKFLGLRGDYLGGIFGINKGGNGFLNIYLIIYATLTAVKYIETRKEKIYSLIFKIGVIGAISSLCELKIVIFELAIIVFIAVLSGDFSAKKMVIIGASIVILYLAYVYMISLFQYSANVFTKEGFLNYTSKSGYTTSNDEFNRLNFITVANDYYLSTPYKRLFGMGVGNCDYSNISIFHSPFAASYSNSHYSWFMGAFTYLEQGLIGLLFYILFFVISIVQSIKRKNADLIEYNTTVKIVSFMSILVFIYNQSMRQDMAFLVYFILAIPYILNKDKYISSVKKQELIDNNAVCGG